MTSVDCVVVEVVDDVVFSLGLGGRHHSIFAGTKIARDLLGHPHHHRPAVKSNGSSYQPLLL